MHDEKKVSYIVILLAVFLLCGCSKEEKKLTGEYRRYYLNPSETTLVKEAYDPKERTTEKMVYEMTDILKETVEGGDYIRLMPKDVDIQDITFEDQIVAVNFNAAYAQMENTREILVRAGIVKSYVQIPGVTYVQFKINGEPLTDSTGAVYGNMDKDTFAEEMEAILTRLFPSS